MRNMSGPFAPILFALVPVIAAIVGATIATFRPPGPTFRSYIQHLAAGVVFSVVAVELLPDIIHQHAHIEVTIGFTLGVICMLGLRSLSHNLEKENVAKESIPIGLLVAVGVDILLDGFLIGVSFSAGAKQGQLLTFALTLELLSLGLAVATALGKSVHNRQRVLTITSLLFLLIVVGSGIGVVLIQYIPLALMEVVLSFGLAALLYLVTEELLVEAHKEPESPMATGMFFIGFLIFLLLGMSE
jgi:zinc transporter, ZIP family